MNESRVVIDKKLDFLMKKLLIQRSLNESAFRKGTSLFRLGLIPANVSDHLPIGITVRLNAQYHKMLTWNLLSDDHLFNNFMNISGGQNIHKKMDALLGERIKNLYREKNMEYHFFAELSQFLYEKRDTTRKIIRIDEEALTAFCNLTSQGTRIVGREATDAEKELVMSARRAFLALYKMEDAMVSHEIRQSILHALEMIYHIKDGALRWETRLACLNSNKELLAQVLDKQLLMFQEATNPYDLLSLFHDKPEVDMALIQHQSNPRAPSKDNCIILFDRNRYELIGEPIKGDIHRKPYIFAVLKDKLTDTLFITSSIHHPGGDADYRQTYLDVVYELRQRHQLFNMPYIIAGDYNHTQSQLREMHILDKSCQLIRRSHGLAELSPDEIKATLNNKPAYVLCNDTLYFIHFEHGGKLIARELHTNNILALSALFPSQPDMLQEASPDNLTHIEKLTGHIPLVTMKLSYPTEGSMAGNDYGNMNKSIDAVSSNISSDNICIQRVDHLITSRPAEPMPFLVQFYSQGKPEPYARQLRHYVLNEGRTDSERESECSLDLNDTERTERVTLTISYGAGQMT